MSIVRKTRKKHGIYPDIVTTSTAADCVSKTIEEAREAVANVSGPDRYRPGKKQAITQRAFERTATPEVLAEHADDMRAIVGEWFNRHSIGWQLQQIEPMILNILTGAGAKLENADNGCRVVDPKCAEAAEGIVRDAIGALHWLDALRLALAANDAQQAALCGLQLGYFMQIMGVRDLEQYVGPGVKCVEDGRAASRRAHGDTATRRAEIRRAFEEKRLADPDLKIEAVYAVLAKRFKCSPRTIRRAVSAVKSQR